MTELDLGLKARTRELFWSMGMSTKVDLPLKSLVPTRPGARASKAGEYFTDLDVLGVSVMPDFSVRLVIADCKTSAKGATERVFWTRGVTEFFGADEAMLVRQHDVPEAARQLATKLDVSIATSNDLDLLTNWHGPGALSRVAGGDFLFDPAAIAQYRKRIADADKRLRNLVEYLGFDYWMYEPHRNLQQLVAHLKAASLSMDSKNPVHFAIFFEAAWLYSLSIIRTAHYARRASVGDLPTAVREYLFGGQLGLREKQEVARVLGTLAGREQRGHADVFPTYLAGIIELVTRFLRRPHSISNVLRYAEWTAEATVTQQNVPIRTAMNGGFDDLAAKLLADVAGFLVTAADLHGDFRTKARGLLMPTENPGASSSRPIDRNVTQSSGTQEATDVPEMIVDGQQQLPTDAGPSPTNLGK